MGSGQGEGMIENLLEIISRKKNMDTRIRAVVK